MCTKGEVDMDENLIIIHSKVHIQIKEAGNQLHLLPDKVHEFESL